MNPERKEVQIFNAALELSSSAERAAYLDQVCAQDGPLRRKVEALLQACGEADNFFQTVVSPAGQEGAPSRPASPGGTALVHLTEKPGDHIGRYKLLQQIGEGGCGVVFMAEQQEPVRRRVALKVIKLGMDTRQVVARFEAERQALAMMDHPNIAKVLDAGATETGRPYFVMELVKGVRITEYCDKNNLRTADRLDLFTKVCSAIQHAHQKGIIHRDIKPSNILVTLHDGEPVPKVIDFGIAKATEARLTDKTLFTAFEQFIGTPAYMSPEQAEMSGLDIDTRSDIYSLGVLLYELLTSKTPFDARELLDAGLDAMRRTIREKEPVRPSTRLETMLEGELTTTAKHHQAEPPKLINLLRGDLDWVVMKALEKDRTRRYETAASLAQDIQRHLHNEPVTARPPSLLYKFQKTIGRHKPAFVAFATMISALLAGFGLTTWQAIRASRAEHAERRHAEQARTDRDRAVFAESNATVNAIEATNALQTARERMVKLNVAEGWRRVEEGDYFGALLPFAEAFALEEHKPDRAEIHQMRLASVLQRCPKLVNVWSVGTNINHAEFSRDGARLLTAGWSEGRALARIWNSATGEAATDPMFHEGGIAFIHWSDDETKIATAADKTARVWDARSGRPLTPPLRMGARVIWVDFDATGTRLVSAAWKEPIETASGYSPNGELAVWDTATGQALWMTNAPMLEIQDFAMFTPHGGEIITAAEVRRADDGAVIRKMNLNTKTLAPGNTATWQTDWPVNSRRVSFDPSGDLLFIAPSPVRYYYDHDREARTKLFYGQQFSNELRNLDYPQRIRLGRFNNDGSRLAVAKEGHVAFVCGSHGSAISKPMQHLGAVTCLTFNQDGSELATTTANGFARAWSAATGEPLSPPLPHFAPLLRAAYAPDGNQLYVIGSDGLVRVWDFRFADLPRFSWPHSRGGALAVHPDTNVMMISLPYEHPMLYSLHTGAPVLPPLRPPDYESLVWSSGGNEFTPDGNRLHGPVEEKESLLSWIDWDVSTGKAFSNSVAATRTWKKVGGISSGGRLELTADRRFVVSSKGDRYVVLEVGSERVVVDQPLGEFSFSDDGKRAIGRKQNGVMVVWHLGTDRPGFEFGDVEPTRYSRGESGDGKRLLTYCKDQYELWNTDSGEKLASFQAQHGKISRDGNWLALANGRHVEFQSIIDRPEQRGSFRTRMDVRWGMQFSPDARLLLTRDDLGGAAIWSVPEGELISAFGELISAFELGADDQLQFGPDNRSMLIRRKDFGIEFWPLLELTRPVTDWLALSSLFADQPKVGSRSASQGWLADWQALRRRHPDLFAATAKDLDPWERQEALRCEARKDWSNAVVHLTRLIELHPDSGDFLPRRAAAYVRWERALSANPQPGSLAGVELLERALADYNRTIEWVNRFHEVAAESRKIYLEPRALLLRRLGRTEEANASLPDHKRIPPRPVGTSSNLVDLTKRFAEVRDQRVPAVVRTLATSVEYDLRGRVVLVAGAARNSEEVYPSQVTGIPILRTVKHLHFLHDADLNPHADAGAPLAGVFATLVIRMANGQSHKVELRLGEDVWYHESKSSEPAPARVSRIAFETEDQMLRLFQRTWKNPTPDVAVDSVDFITGDSDAYPVLYAITIEP